MKTVSEILEVSIKKAELLQVRNEESIKISDKYLSSSERESAIKALKVFIKAIGGQCRLKQILESERIMTIQQSYISGMLKGDKDKKGKTLIKILDFMNNYEFAYQAEIK